MCYGVLVRALDVLPWFALPLDQSCSDVSLTKQHLRYLGQSTKVLP